MASSLISFSNELAALVENSAGPVVAVHGRSRFNSSGVHWSPGVVVTGEHTLHRDEEVTITTASGDRMAAEVAGRDPGTDLAILKVKDLKIPTAVRAEGAAHRAGTLVVAVGRNRESANAGVGVISSVAGKAQTRRGGELDQVIRLDVTLHPVAAGGAVVDASGKVIGIATPVLSRASVFAVPNATVDRVVQALLAHGRLPQGYLGAGLQPIRLPDHLIQNLGLANAGGLMTVSVDQDAPAGKAGLAIGDVLVELNGEAADRPEALRPMLARSVGKTIAAKVVRVGKLETLNILVAERPGEIEMGIGEIGELLRRSTVQVRGEGRRGETRGSGVIWDLRGTIVTNAHVLGGGGHTVELWNGTSLPAEIISRDDQRDLAALRLSGPASPAAVFREQPVRAGEFVVAVGNPLGFTGALTTGTVHSAGPFPGLGRRVWVQAAIRLAPGNSGGPLADASGHVVGINSMMVSGGIALAIPSGAVSTFLRTGPSPRLGVTVRTIRFRKRGGAGLLVLGVEPESPAARASLLTGDVLTGADALSFTAAHDLGDAISEAQSGRMTLRFLRGDRAREREVVIALPRRFSREAA